MWIITKEFDLDQERRSETNFQPVWIGSERFKKLSFEQQLEFSSKYIFRLYDDDGNLYYEGFSDDRDSEAAFAPLDDYGLPNDGCTEIRYLINNKWETL